MEILIIAYILTIEFFTILSFLQDEELKEMGQNTIGCLLFAMVVSPILCPFLIIYIIYKILSINFNLDIKKRKRKNVRTKMYNKRPYR